MYFYCGYRNVHVWDARKMQSKKNPKPLETLVHSKSVNSAYFSPVTGQSIVTTSMDDRIRSAYTQNLISSILTDLQSCIVGNILKVSGSACTIIVQFGGMHIWELNHQCIVDKPTFLISDFCLHVFSNVSNMEMHFNIQKK